MFRTVFSGLSPGGRRARLSILIFHRVLAEPDPLFPGEVTRAQFDAICGWLRAWCNVLPLGPAAMALKEGTLPSRAVAITFDDGYADNHSQAAPVLARHGLTATFFVASGFLDGGRMWNDTVIESIRGCVAQQIDLTDTCAASLGVLSLGSTDDRRKAIESVINRTKYLEPNQRAEWVDAVARRAGAPLSNQLMLTSDAVRALWRAGHSIGGHTVSHPILKRLHRTEATREVREGRLALEAVIGERVRLFAYPNGRAGTDYDDEAVEIVKESGFDVAVSTLWRAARSDDDILELPRYTPWDRSRARFGLRMAQALMMT